MEYKADLDKLRHSCSHVMAQATRLILIILMSGVCTVAGAEMTPERKSSWVEAEDAAIAGNFEQAEAILREILDIQEISYQELESANDSLTIINNYKQGLLKSESAIHFFKAMQSSGNDDHKRGINELESAARLEPDQWLFSKYLARAYFRENDLKQAAYYAQKVIEKNKEDGTASWVLCLSYGTDENIPVKLSEALGYCERANVVVPNDPYVLTKLGGIYLESGDCPAALPNFKKAMKIDADCPALKASYVFMGTCEYSAGQVQEAIDYFNKAIELNPNNPMVLLSAHGFLATIYTDLKEDARASAELQEVKNNCGGCSEEQIKEMMVQLKEGLKTVRGHGIQN